MLRRLLISAALVVTGLFAALPANAERRVALVVGNSEYAKAASLRNPRNDANDIANTLKTLGFEVELGLDLDQPKFAVAIEGFARQLEGADVALFFYAGHGLQMNDKNYLVSTNAKLENEFLLSSETIELDAIVRLMESKTAINLVFLDACRNNPLAEELRRSLAATKRAAALGRGLARMEPTGRDTLIAFAAAPGQEAIDGRDRNSPFTASLLKNLPRPGVEVSVMLKEVAADVRRDTRNAQRPQQLSDMSRTFYFTSEKAAVPPAAVAMAQPAQPAPPAPRQGGSDQSVEVAFWSAAQSANDCESVRVYLQRFPNGTFVELAKLAERRLCVASRQVTVLDAASPPAAVSPVPPMVPPPTETPAATPPGPPPVMAALPEPTTSPSSVETEADLARNIQLELIRLGCSTANPDGKWGQPARAAIGKFNRYAKATLDAREPTSQVIAALRDHDERVCPLECGRGFRAKDDVCVAVESVRPPRERNTRPERPQRPQRAQAPAAAPRASGGPPAKFHSSICQSHIQQGGKWCCTYDPPRGASIISCP